MRDDVVPKICVNNINISWYDSYIIRVASCPSGRFPNYFYDMCAQPENRYKRQVCKVWTLCNIIKLAWPKSQSLNKLTNLWGKKSLSMVIWVITMIYDTRTDKNVYYGVLVNNATCSLGESRVTVGMTSWPGSRQSGGLLCLPSVLWSCLINRQ